MQCVLYHSSRTFLPTIYWFWWES